MQWKVSPIEITPPLVTNGLEHERLYKASIIHREISTNNILISSGKESLIDFDHSKITTCTQTRTQTLPLIIDFSDSWTMTVTWTETLLLLTLKHPMLKTARGGQFSKVEEGVLEFAKWRLGHRVFSYLYSVAKMWQLDLENSDMKTMADFGWDGEVSH